MNLNNSVTHCVAADNKGFLSLSLSEILMRTPLARRRTYAYTNTHLLLAGMYKEK
jgi:hypothetical protein